MKLQVVIACLIAAATAAEDVNFCYGSVKDSCSADSAPAASIPHCNSKYGGFAKEEDSVINYVHSNLVKNFQYLLLATHFTNYEKNRPGFEKLYRGLSDEAWNDAIKMIKYTTRRGGKVIFKEKFDTAKINATFAHNELASLATALDWQKTMALEAHELHKKFSNSKATKVESKDQYDPDISSFLENEFLSKFSENIRTLSGHTNDLKRLLEHNKISKCDNANDGTLSTFLFDEYLQKL